ncbi:MAG: 3-isopropylmalate dehydratase [bacterium]
MKIRGRAFCFGDDVSTDVHLSVKYRPPGATLEDLKRDAFKDLDPGFASAVRAGDVVVAGVNFGLVSSRADSALVLRELGVSCVLARSFGHMFYRNALNMGLPAIECDTGAISAGDEVEVEPEAGVVRVRDETISFPPFPPTLWSMLQAGGIIPFLKQEGDFPEVS